jgi:hypothetical protein
MLLLLSLLLHAASVGADAESGALRYSYDDAEFLSDPNGLLGSFYGTSVAMNSKYLMVGSIGDGATPYRRSGSVYVYSTLQWKFIEKITPIEMGANFQFGSSLALSDADSAVVIGSPYAHIDVAGVDTNCGVAHVFEVDKLLGLHKQVAQLFPHDGGQYDEFGKAVSIYQNTIAVSANHHNNGKGSVYMYQQDVYGIWQNHSVLSVNVLNVLYFGHSIALSENSIVVSSLHGNDAGERSSVFIFERSADTAPWVQSAYLLPSIGSPGDEFGISLSLVDGLLAVGSRYASITLEKAGAVYIYQKGASEWSETAILTSTNGQALGFFGDTVAIGDNYISIGSFGWKDAETSDIVGAVYVFTKVNGHDQWVEKTILVSSHGSNNDFFSKALSVYGQYIAVGAAGDDLNTMNSGGAFHFDMNANYHRSQTEEEVVDTNSHSVLITFFILMSLCCCGCFGMGCCPGKKWRRMFCKDCFGINIGKKKPSKRHRHIRDINDVQHSPLQLDDSISGADNESNLHMLEDATPLPGGDREYEMRSDLQKFDSKLDAVDQTFDNIFECGRAPASDGNGQSSNGEAVHSVNSDDILLAPTDEGDSLFI